MTYNSGGFSNDFEPGDELLLGESPMGAHEGAAWRENDDSQMCEIGEGDSDYEGTIEGSHDRSEKLLNASLGHGPHVRNNLESGPRVTAPATGNLNLLDMTRMALRRVHYSLRTENSYVAWVRRFVVFQGMRWPHDMGLLEVEQFLNHLAMDKRICAGSQNQALQALRFLFIQVVKKDIGLVNVKRARSSNHIPEVFSREEVARILGVMHGMHRVIAGMLYGSGLRLAEALSLRMKDLDFDRRQVCKTYVDY